MDRLGLEIKNNEDLLEKQDAKVRLARLKGGAGL